MVACRRAGRLQKVVARGGSTVSFIFLFNIENGNDKFKYIYIRETSIPVGIRRRDWRDPKALICCTLRLRQVVHNQAKTKK